MIFHRLPSGSRRRVGKTLSVLTWRCWWRPTVDGGGKRGQNSGGLVTFHSAPFPLGRGVLSERPAAVKGARRCCAAKRTPSRRGPSVLRSSTRGKGVASRYPDSEDTSGAFASTIKTGKPYIQTE